MRLLITITALLAISLQGSTLAWAETAQEREQDDIRYAPHDSVIEDNLSDVEVRSDPYDASVEDNPHDSVIEDNPSDVEVRSDPADEDVRFEPHEDW